MGTTAIGLPYPEPTEPIAQGADAIKQLATALQSRGAVAAAAFGTATIAMTGGTQSAATVVTFPAGRFTAAPQLWLTVNNTGSSSMYTPRLASAPGTTGFSLVLNTAVAFTGTTILAWHAMQPTSGVSLAALEAQYAALEDVGTGPDRTVTCPTDGCPNEGIELTVAGVPDGFEDGGVICGGCGTILLAGVTS